MRTKEKILPTKLPSLLAHGEPFAIAYRTLAKPLILQVLLESQNRTNGTMSSRGRKSKNETCVLCCKSIVEGRRGTDVQRWNLCQQMDAPLLHWCADQSLQATQKISQALPRLFLGWLTNDELMRGVTTTFARSRNFGSSLTSWIHNILNSMPIDSEFDSLID